MSWHRAIHPRCIHSWCIQYGDDRVHLFVRTGLHRQVERFLEFLQLQNDRACGKSWRDQWREERFRSVSRVQVMLVSQKMLKVPVVVS